MSTHAMKIRPGGLLFATVLWVGAIASGTATAAVNTPPADNSYTSAGTQVDNFATLDYEVGAINQTDIDSLTDTFYVDRRIAVDVVEYDNATTLVTPLQTVFTNVAVTSFLVTNTSNTSIDVNLAAANAATATADPHGGNNDSFDTGAFTFFIDDGDGVLDGGDGAAVTHLNALAADDTVTVLVVPASIPDESNDEVAVVTLTATARTNNGAATLGAAFADDAGNLDTPGASAVDIQNVLEQVADTDSDSYTIATAELSITKSSAVTTDPINLAVNPKRIPGATIRYTITVANAVTATAAADVVVFTDDLDTAVFDDGSVVVFFDEDDDGVCEAAEAAHASITFATPTVTADVDAAETAATAGTDNNDELDPGESLLFCVDVDIL